MDGEDSYTLAIGGLVIITIVVWIIWQLLKGGGGDGNEKP